jgi:hypothetical protein
MHESTDSEVSHHEAIELLPNQVWGLAAQYDLGASQMGLEFIQRRFNLSPLVIEGR